MRAERFAVLLCALTFTGASILAAAGYSWPWAFVALWMGVVLVGRLR